MACIEISYNILVHLMLQECDLGQQSVLHAVKTPHKKFKNHDTSGSIEECTSETSDWNDSGSKPMNETLTDLSLDSSDQQCISQEGNSNINSTNISYTTNKKLTCSFMLLSTEGQENRAHFYIYCSGPCKTVTVGKLRVKCAICNSGAVTVDRDPQCWPDVLEPNRITVHCENDFCPASSTMLEEEFQITYAHFYFKCAKHVSLGEDDQAIPLHLIRANLRNIPCLACTDIRYLVT